MKDGRSEKYHEWLKAKDTIERGNSNTETADKDTVDTSTADPKTVATNTVDTVTADPDTTENSDSVPDGMTLENFSFTYMAGSEEALVGIANHVAGLSPSGRVEVTMRYHP